MYHAHVCVQVRMLLGPIAQSLFEKKLLPEHSRKPYSHINLSGVCSCLNVYACAKVRK